jgi:hypothetical protein
MNIPILSENANDLHDIWLIQKLSLSDDENNFCIFAQSGL